MNHVVQYEPDEFVQDIGRVMKLYEDMSESMNNKAQKGRFNKMVVAAGAVKSAVEQGEELPLPLEKIMERCKAAGTTIGRGSMISYLSTMEIEMDNKYAFWTRQPKYDGRQPK